MIYKTNPFEEAKRYANMRKILEYHRIVIRNNRCRCFIHDGKDFNMSVNEQFCHCFSCGENADIFKAQMLLGGDAKPIDALHSINDIFALSLDFGGKKTVVKTTPIPYQKSSNEALEKDYKLAVVAVYYTHHFYAERYETQAGADRYAEIYHELISAKSDVQKKLALLANYIFIENAIEHYKDIKEEEKRTGLKKWKIM